MGISWRPRKTGMRYRARAPEDESLELVRRRGLEPLMPCGASISSLSSVFHRTSPGIILLTLLGAVCRKILRDTQVFAVNNRIPSFHAVCLVAADCHSDHLGYSSPAHVRPAVLLMSWNWSSENVNLTETG